MTYNCAMVFIETTIFTRQVQELLSDEAYGQLQQHLTDNPESGDVIPDTHGLRKARWAADGRGKRGGVRVIYFHVSAASQMRMLLIYKKAAKDNLSPREKQMLRKLNQDWR